jgi:hypothetical protein
MKQPPVSDFVLRSCWLKEAFTCRSLAQRAATRINNTSSKRVRIHVEPFRCRVCGAFHIGKRKKP